jgi:hypothetical protein
MGKERAGARSRDVTAVLLKHFSLGRFLASTTCDSKHSLVELLYKSRNGRRGVSKLRNRIGPEPISR